MKRLITQLALLIAVLCASVQAHAYDCEVDGIYYNLNSSDNTAEVTSGDEKYEEAIKIPRSVRYNGSSYSVTSIGQGAFRGCSGLTSVIIPESVTSIGEMAFYGCRGLTSVTIGNSVTSIGNYAFCYCSGLTSVTIQNSVTSIGRGVFYGCSGLMSVTIPNSVTSIGEYAFYGCSGLTSVTIPNSVTSIGELAFYGCTGLTSVTNPASATSIGNSIFSNCSGLTSIVVDKGNKNYDSRDNCNAIIETATNTLITGCNSTIIPESVTSIGNYAFNCCSGLTSVTIPESVTSIGWYAFLGCSGLTSVTCLAPNPPKCGNSALTDIDKSKCTLYVLKESVNLYKAAVQWKDFYNISEYDGVDDITVDGDDAETLYDVYNVQGMMVGSGMRRADMSDALPHGIYILVSPNGTQKIRL